jgi:hypothetical protein
VLELLVLLLLLKRRGKEGHTLAPPPLSTSGSSLLG